jgi:hypothetical protein
MKLWEDILHVVDIPTILCHCLLETAAAMSSSKDQEVPNDPRDTTQRHKWIDLEEVRSITPTRVQPQASGCALGAAAYHTVSINKS